MDKNRLEETVMTLIMQAGQTRSLLMQAIAMAKEKKFQESEQLMHQAEKCLQKAHNIQTSLISFDEGEGRLPINIILIHAQDHIMNAVLLMDIAKELIVLHKG